MEYFAFVMGVLIGAALTAGIFAYIFYCGEKEVKKVPASSNLISLGRKQNNQYERFFHEFQRDRDRIAILGKHRSITQN